MKINLINIAALLFTISLITAQTAVNIKTNRSDAAIFVNDSLIAEGNASIVLEPGKYEIKLRAELKNWNSQVLIDSISINENSKSITKEYNFEDQVFVDSSPQDAYIFSGDSLIANTPVYIPLKFSEVQLRKPNYESKKLTLNSTSNKNVELDFTGELKQKSFTESVWFKALLGSAVVLGTTAAYFKIKADNRFDEYEKNRDKTLLDEIDRYDTYSGIAFGALQINFGLILYLFLTD